MKIGLSLSGGGVRATVFHLGVLERLARDSLLEDVTFLSTVSGGSLSIGLVCSACDDAWPDSGRYREETVPRIRSLLTSVDLQRAFAWRSMIFPSRLLRGRASILARVLRKKWGITSDVSRMIESPRWIINATCYETGKNWRFMRKRMGDYIANYVADPRFPLAEALAASAAVPYLVGSLKFYTREFDWFRYRRGSRTDTEPVDPIAPILQLWDGGVYDNLGVEALWKPEGGLRQGVDFLLVSDASKPLATKPSTALERANRLVDIATDQVRSIRARDIVAYLSKCEAGAFLRAGLTQRAIFDLAGTTPPAGWDESATMDEGAASSAANLPTTLRRLSEGEFDGLFRHGYEVAGATLAAYSTPFRHGRIPGFDR